VTVRLGRWQEALADVEEVDALIVDAPYSERTHGGHDTGAEQAGYRAGDGGSESDTRRMRVDRRTGTVYAVGGANRRSITYTGWSPDDVAEFVSHWAPRVRWWIVTITDHVLAPVWADALSDAGRYVFAPLPWVAPGSRVRLAGDGPSCWTCWIVVARPRGAPYSTWGTLPGAYVYTQDRDAVIGGKPLALMRALVRDYSRPGDLICDPCAGGGTTLLAARIEGRRWIGAEVDPDTHALALERLAEPYTAALL